MFHGKTFLVTDGCMWEINKATGNEHPHAIEVVDIETGAVRYIKSGSFIAFISGEITDIRTQAGYNQATTNQVLPNSREGVSKSNKRKKKSGGNESKSL